MKMFFLGGAILLSQAPTTQAPPAVGGPSSQAAPSATLAEVTTPNDPKQRMELAENVNGLQGLEIPWHVKATYEVFAPDGKSTDTGSYEEWRVNAKQYRIALHSPSISAEEFGTDHGVFRTGKQGWPRKPLSSIQWMIAQPIPPPTDPEKTKLKNYERNFGGTKVPCTALISSDSHETTENAEGYCFAPNNAILLYSTESDRVFQTLFEKIALVHGHYLAYDMQLLLDGKPWLKVHIEKVEGLGAADQLALTLPAGASPVTVLAAGRGDIAAGHQIKDAAPEYPMAAREQGVQGTVVVDAVIDTAGHMQQLQVLAGPQALRQAAMNAVSQWVYTPYLLDGKPVAVEAEIYVRFALGR
jgi:TonB family protein